MVKSKPKQPPTDMEECVQDGWVVVKKQKVTILIPPLPITEPNAIPNPEETPSPPIPTEKIDHITPPQPDPPPTKEKPAPLTTTSPKLTHRPTVRNRHNYEPSRHKKLRICSAPKARNHSGNLVIGHGHMLVDPKMRALNLERKIERAGGLNNWLVSLGLGQFVKIFRCKRVGKVQLVNMSMKKLKDMGAHAVGPRRKLMHAIDCLW